LAQAQYRGRARITRVDTTHLITRIHSDCKYTHYTNLL
jgi:hypothetical protein